MADLFDSPLSAISFALKAGTDGNSPLTQALMDKLRKGIEILVELTFGTGDSGTATGDPSETVLTDTAASFAVDGHNTRTLFILSGNAAGNLYTIDDTTATTLTCTGDTLYTDGVRSGDEYLVLYNIKKARSAGGHVHDGDDSKAIENPRGRTLVFCHGAEETNNAAAYAEILKYNVYIPDNPTSLEVAAEIKVTTAGSATIYVRVTVTDADSNTATGTDNHSSGTWNLETMSIDCSSLVAGYGTILIEMHCESSGNTAHLKGITGHWNT